MWLLRCRDTLGSTRGPFLLALLDKPCPSLALVAALSFPGLGFPS